MTNALDDNGIVHSCEMVPQTHPANERHITRAGFTWCLMFFTWRDEGRFHPPEDGAEYRLARSEAPTSCLKCIAGECGTNTGDLL